MNKFGKIVACTLGAVTVAGAVGAVCYNQIPAFKSTVNKAFKIGEDDKANIGLDVKDTTTSNPNEILPITPEEFKATYKIAVPSEFLGEYLYVKKLSTDNLLISSSVCTSILYYKKATNETKQIYLENKNWKYFEELDNGDVFIASSEDNSGLLVFNVADETVKKIYSSDYGMYSRYKLSTGNYYIGMNTYGLFVDVSTYKVTSLGYLISPDKSYGSTFIDLGNDAFLISFYRSKKKLYYYDYATMSEAKSLGDLCCIELFKDEERVVFLGSATTVYEFRLDDLSLTLLYTGETICSGGDTWLFPTRVYNYGDNLLICGYGGFFKFDKTACEYSKVLDCYSAYKYSFRDLKNGHQIVYLQNTDYCLIFFFNTTTFEMTRLGSILCTSIYIEEFDNGDLFIGGIGVNSNTSSSSGYLRYTYHFSNSTNTLKQLWYNGNGLGYIRLPNDKILALTNQNLYLFNPADCSYTLLCKFDSSASLSLVEQEDGTVLIETGEDIKYEYDYKTDTLRLVYVASM